MDEYISCILVCITWRFAAFYVWQMACNFALITLFLVLVCCATAAAVGENFDRENNHTDGKFGQNYPSNTFSVNK